MIIRICLKKRVAVFKWPFMQRVQYVRFTSVPIKLFLFYRIYSLTSAQLMFTVWPQHSWCLQFDLAVQLMFTVWPQHSWCLQFDLNTADALLVKFDKNEYFTFKRVSKNDLCIINVQGVPEIDEFVTQRVNKVFQVAFCFIFKYKLWKLCSACFKFS